MIQLKNITKSFGDRSLFKDVTFSLQKGDKVGLVGRNGEGKSTLAKIIYGELTADQGQIITPKNYRVGMLSQQLNFSQNSILEEVVVSTNINRESELYLVEKTLEGLGFAQTDFNKSPELFSGGFQIRLNLAKLIISSPDLLILDEPNNYLDIVSLQWLISSLKTWKGEFILITHDRSFMDKVINTVVGLHGGIARKVVGDTTKYYSELLKEQEILEKTNQNRLKRASDIENFVKRFRAKASKAKQVQSRIKMLEKMDLPAKKTEEQFLDFSFNYQAYKSKNAVEVSQLTFGFKGTLLFENLSFSLKQQECLAIIGANGKGKSTLLKLLAGLYTPISGEINYHPEIKIGHFNQSNIETLNPLNSIEQEVSSVNVQLSRTEVKNICGLMMFEGDDSSKLIKVLSGGEKARVMLGKVMASPCNLLLLDEPSNHLDMESIESLINAINCFPGAVCLVTHSEDMIHSCADNLVIFRQNQAEYFHGGYERFLDKVGWIESSPKNKPSKLSTNQKSLERKKNKRIKAEIIEQRAKILTPFKNKINLIEEKIMQVEDKIAQFEDQLCFDLECDKQTVSLQLGQEQKVLDALNSEYEELVENYGQIEDDFERKLQELN